VYRIHTRDTRNMVTYYAMMKNVWCPHCDFGLLWGEDVWLANDDTEGVDDARYMQGMPKTHYG